MHRALVTLCYFTRVYEMASLSSHRKQELLFIFITKLSTYEIPWIPRRTSVGLMQLLINPRALYVMLYMCTKDVNRISQ